MAAAKYNLVIDQGSDFSLEITIKEQGVLKDLTGYSARAQLRSNINSSEVSASFICTVLQPASEGKIKIELPNMVSSEMSAGRYVYDLEIYTPNNVIVKRLIQGEAILNSEVTK